MSDDLRSRAIAADADARLRAQSVFDEPVVVDAGAGTGKTNILVARIVVWSLSQGWERASERLAADAKAGPPPDEKIAAEVLGRVAAITFTDAAAAEMALRTGETLVRIADGDEPIGVAQELLPPDLELRCARSRMLIGALDHLVVRTIHAFCRGLLAQYPLEAKLHPGFQVDADELVQAEVVREAVESAAVRAYTQPPDPDWVALAVDGYGPDRIETAVAQLVAAGASPDALADDPFSPDRVAAYVAALDGALVAFESEDGGRLAGAKRVKTAVATVEAIGRTRARIGEGVEASLAGLSRFFDEAGAYWSDAASKRIGEWAKGKFAKGEAKALDEETEAVSRRAGELASPLARLRDLDPERLQRALRVIQPLLVEVFEQMLTGGRQAASGGWTENRCGYFRAPRRTRSAGRESGCRAPGPRRSRSVARRRVPGHRPAPVRLDPLHRAGRRLRRKAGAVSGRRPEAVDLRLAPGRPRRVRRLHPRGSRRS